MKLRSQAPAGGGNPFTHLLSFGRRPKAEGTPPAEDANKPKEGTDGEPADPEDEPTDPAATDPQNDPAAENKPTDPEAGEDDPAEEMHGTSAVAEARRRERARCAAIFASAGAGADPALAARLAFNTTLPRAEAIAALGDGSAPRGRRSGLDERMTAAPTPHVTPGAAAADPKAGMVDGMASLMRKAAGRLAAPAPSK